MIKIKKQKISPKYMNSFMNNRIIKLGPQKISLKKRLMLLVKNYLRIIMLKTIQKNILHYQIKISVL